MCRRSDLHLCECRGQNAPAEKHCGLPSARLLRPFPGYRSKSRERDLIHSSSCPRKCRGYGGFPGRRGRQELQQADVAGEKQPQSFFQRAYAKKLRLHAKSLSGEDKGHGSVCSGFNQRGMDNLTSGDSKMHESERGLLGSSRNSSVTNVANVSVAPPEARVSTSGCAATNCETLTCPVCFGEVRTTNLNVFNRHIDQCLSGVTTKPHQTTDTDSESDGDGGLKGLTAKDEWIEEDKGVTRSEDTTDGGTLERCSRDEPLLDHHSFLNVHSSQRASLSRDGNPGTLTSHLESQPSHEASTLICPVCQVPQNTDDLTVFNRHVDLCLNQEVLHKLGEHASSSSSSSSASVRPPITAKKSKGEERDQHKARPNKGKSKRRGPPSSPPAKKAKALGSQNTIDKFLR
ncbi:DNA polymerase kappa [Merluccius polli]|uniref:DNA polymerase kappa n=1 Tax=Merluccius polli TaxID=89951 RepID=A0AA47MPQ6_MERPO|nr:DNA polymerase kappa [Merluccius polli]